MIDDPRIASIPIHDEWIDEAGAQLKAFRSRQLVARFMQRHGLPHGGLAAGIAEIQRCIRATDHPLRLDDLAAYLDELKACGRQFAFLWRLKEGQEAAAYLAKLSDPDDLKGMLGNEQGDLLDNGRLIWESDVPALAEVRHPGAGGVLSFKWIASRRYWTEEEPADPNAPPVLVRKTQRAVTFFKLDLRNGDCELRIHSLPYGAKGLPGPRDEFERYRSEVEKFVDLSCFSPVLIEPVAHDWLLEPIRGLVITNWSVVRPTGEFLNGGGGGSVISSKLKLLVGEYFARDVTLKWECKQHLINRNQNLFFSLDGHADGIDFNGLADASRVDFLLDQVRRHERPALHMRALRQLAAKYPEHIRILASLDYLFFTRKESRVSVRGVAKDVWYAPGTIRRVFELAAEEFPKEFTLAGDVLALRNRLRVREGGLVEVLERYAKKNGHPAAHALVAPVIGVLTLIALRLYDLLLSWIWSSFFESLTGVPYDAVEVGLLLLFGALHLVVTFGGARLRGWALRLLRLVRSVFRWLEPLTGQDGPTLQGTCDAMYEEWLALPAPAPGRRDRAVPRAPGPGQPLQPAAP